MNSDTLRNQISQFLDFSISDAAIAYRVLETTETKEYTRSRITYPGEDGDEITAFLLLPHGRGPFAAVLIHHQHHGQRHLGKSEVCGLVGDRLQAFGPALAKLGMVVLAPDSICFEDRRRGCSGTEPDELDATQHYDEMCYRLVRGDTLMRKVLDDSARTISLLQAHPLVDSSRIGLLGHSYGGNTVLFHAPLDNRIAFACSSGAACSYRYKIGHQVGIEIAEVIPGFALRFDIADLVRCMAPRHILLVSATEDKYSMDAGEIEQEARESYAALNVASHLEHKRYEGPHALNWERFDYIVNWLDACAQQRV